ncbi:MAG: 23S rRNA (uracil(1939)-C(5))-methyltransferase RlmD [Chitinispirillaceae bacterium]|nr:23S rRNA (uracil(1939)-C(5))-methyltransferase RlmD [Chitinispirillaceae bacterium]
MALPGNEKSCPHFPECGGCQILDQPYEIQLHQKTALLRSLFSFSSGLEIGPVIGCNPPYWYRHKVQLPFGGGPKGRAAKVLLGCYGRDSHKVVDQHVCLVQDKDLSLVAWTIREWAVKHHLSIYNEKKHAGFLRHVLLRKAAGTGEVLVGLVTNGPRPAGTRNLSTTLLEMVATAAKQRSLFIAGIVQNVNMHRTNVVLGEQENTWWGRPFLFEKLGSLRFKLGLSTFFQVNPFQTPRLYDEVLKWIRGGPSVLECYCGVGSIALWIAPKCRIVTGIEENGASVAAAKKAAQVNGARNVRFVKGDVGALFPTTVNNGYDIAVFDPPRTGLDASITAALRKAALNRIIYVSCNPETLARDVLALSPCWRLVSLQGIDMFPHTSHIECVAVLDRNT